MSGDYCYECGRGGQGRLATLAERIRHSRIGRAIWPLTDPDAKVDPRGWGYISLAEGRSHVDMLPADATPIQRFVAAEFDRAHALIRLDLDTALFGARDNSDDPHGITTITEGTTP